MLILCEHAYDCSNKDCYYITVKSSKEEIIDASCAHLNRIISITEIGGLDKANPNAKFKRMKYGF